MQSRERPIRFNAMSIRALSARRKTQARFVVKGQEQTWDAVTSEWDVKDEESFVVCGRAETNGLRPILTAIKCPYGQVGDRLWVRETFSIVPDHDEPAGHSLVLYRADGQGPYGKWRPSTQMPREASRILLEIVRVRVERLHDIGEDDAIAEGAQRDDTPDKPHFKLDESVRTARFAYRSTWNDAKPGCSWEGNPWVWVLEFRRVEAA